MRTVFKVLIALVALVVLGIGAFIWFMGHAKKTLGPVAEQFMQKIGQGKYDEAYNDASPAFKSSLTAAKFRGFCEENLAPLGSFQRLGDISGVSMRTSSGEGTTGELSAELVFEKGTVPGTFAFQKADGVWRVQHVKVDGLDKHKVPPDPAALEPAWKALFAAYDAADWERMHGMVIAAAADDIPTTLIKEKMSPVHDLCATFGSPVLKATDDQAVGVKELTFAGSCPDGAPVRSVQVWSWRGTRWRLQNVKVTKDPGE
jgi:hypothetical protein